MKVIAHCCIRLPKDSAPNAVLKGEGPDGETYVCLVLSKFTI